MNKNHNNPMAAQVDDADFHFQVLRSKQPVLAAFLTPWSQPCQVIAPVLDDIASESAGKLRVVKVNADRNPDLSLWYDVQSIPTVLYFVAGHLRGRIVGTASKEALLAKLQALSGPAQDDLQDPTPLPPIERPIR